MRPRSVGIVGGGTMGAGIAQVAVEAGWRVTVHDADAHARDRARTTIADGPVRRARRTGLDDGAHSAWVAERLSLVDVVSDLEPMMSTCELVIEAIVEDLAAKRAVFGALDDAVAEDALLATNTSALSVAAIAAATARPERVIGLHFFNPAPLMQLVEVVAPAGAARSAVERGVDIVESWGKTAIVCTDRPGFVVNRVNRPYTLEALTVLEDGDADIATIDASLRAAGYPMGPFELMDLIGVDVTLTVSRAIHAASVALGDPDADRFRPSPVQERLVAARRLGSKSGRGFYDHPRPRATPAEAADGVAGDIHGTSRALDGPAERVVLAIVAEAYRAKADGVADEVEIDRALELGAGHPRGPFAMAREMGGRSEVARRMTALRSSSPRLVVPAALVDAGD